MTTAGFILRNALRNKRRFALTVLSVAVSLFLLTTLLTALKLITDPPSGEQSSLRIVTRHRVSLANVLPSRYQSRIERMAGVERVTKFTYFGGLYKDEASSNFAQFAVDADRIFRIFPEATVPPQQEEAFIREKSACVVGVKLAERFGWKLGDKIHLRGTIFGVDPELVIRGFYTGKGIDETIVWFHHDYFDELMGNLGFTGTFWIQAESAEAIPDLIERIDASFRNSAAETKTETERAFQLGFISMLGNVKLLLGSISSVIVFTMLLVTASTMSMAVRERAREIAILKAVGYDGRRVFALILAESLGLAAAGGSLGCLGAKFLFSALDIYKLSRGYLPMFPVTADIVALGLFVALALGLISALLPARSTVRMSVVEGLRTLD